MDRPADPNIAHARRAKAEFDARQAEQLKALCDHVKAEADWEHNQRLKALCDRVKAEADWEHNQRLKALCDGAKALGLAGLATDKVKALALARETDPRILPGRPTVA